MKRIIRFTASWCNPCKALAKNLEEANLGVPIEVIDIDIFPDLAQEYGIRSVPVLVLKEENVESKRLIGLKSTKELKEWVGHD